MSDPDDPTTPTPAAGQPGGGEPTGAEPPVTEPTGAEPTGAEPLATEPPGTEPGEPTEGSEGPDRRILIAVGAIVVLVVIGAIIFALGGDDDEVEDVVIEDVEGDDEAIAAPETFELGEVYTSSITFADGPVAHTTTLEGGSIVTIETSSAEDSEGGISYQATIEGTPVASASLQPGQEDSQELVLGGESGGDLRLEFSGEGTYTFAVTEEGQDDGGTGGDAGDELATASSASAGTLDGVVGGTDAADFYAIDVPAGALLDVSIANDATSSSSVRAEVLFNGERIEVLDAQPGGEEGVSRVVAGDAGGEYIFSVSGGGPRSDYVLGVSSEAQNDGGGSGDAPGELADARSITVGEALSGQLGNEDRTDFYSFDVPGGSAISVQVANDPSSSASVRAELFFNGERIDLVDVQPGGEDAIEQLAGAAQAGEYALSFTAGGADYDFTVSVEAQNDGGQEGDAPDDAAEAVRIEPGTELAGRLGNADQTDHYVFAATGPAATIDVASAAESGGPFRLEALVNSERADLVDVRPGATGTLELDGLSAGTDVVLRFTSGAPGAQYTFTVS